MCGSAGQVQGSAIPRLPITAEESCQRKVFTAHCGSEHEPRVPASDPFDRWDHLLLAITSHWVVASNQWTEGRDFGAPSVHSKWLSHPCLAVLRKGKRLSRSIKSDCRSQEGDQAPRRRQQVPAPDHVQRTTHCSPPAILPLTRAPQTHRQNPPISAQMLKPRSTKFPASKCQPREMSSGWVRSRGR